MDFARKQLEKYGWTDGKGLGKYETGMSEALKPKLKRSMTGIGHDAAADFTEHWWSALYDKAASNIEVKEKDGSTKKIKAKDSTNFQITNSTWKLHKKHKSESQEQYKDFFVRTAVLGSGGSRVERVRASEDEEDCEDKNVVKMTDEELFAACGGRTAHKGARHGLKALGKLARIEQQEQLLLQQPQFSGYSHAKKLKQKTENDNEIVEEASLTCDEGPTVSKKKKKKRKHCFAQENNENNSEVNAEEFVKKKKNKNCFMEDVDDSLDLEDVRSLLEDTEMTSNSVAIDENGVSKKKKKKLKKDAEEGSELSTVTKKPKKKRKHKDIEDCEMDISSESKKKAV
ncbi:G patch domain-containing protein 4 [Epargyreus clarus]|uniref:G patch domain-containing protein 4 n=1 Tax=Epargyreus clarus TaxID=520877 RepID=UPI003C2B161E